CSAASRHPGTKRWGARSHPAQALPVEPWFPGRWPTTPHRSIGMEHDFAPKNRAIHRIGKTIASPALEFLEMPAGKKPASHPADRRAADKDARSEGPTAS